MGTFSISLLYFVGVGGHILLKCIFKCSYRECCFTNYFCLDPIPLDLVVVSYWL